MSLTQVATSMLQGDGSQYGFRNRIINGSMLVDQRNAGASQTFTAGAALAYCVDRFYGYCTGANITGQQVTVGGNRRYRFTGAASNTGLGFGQRIEAINCSDMNNQAATLQVKLSSNALTTVNWAVYYANTTDTFGTVAAPTRTLVSSGSFTITSTEATYSAAISVPSAATTGIEIVFSTGALLATQTLTIGDVQFELGSTTFERRPIGVELQLCERYFEKSYPVSVAPGTAGTTLVDCINLVAVNGVDFQYFGQVWMQTRKRANATFVLYNPITGSSANIRGRSDSSNALIAIVRESSTKHFNVYSTSNNATTGFVYSFHYTADAEL